MKIVNGKLEFDTVVCWDCQGKKEVTRGDLCPRWGKTVKNIPGRICGCGAKNKHSHKVIGHHQETCHTCGGKGTRLEGTHDIMTAAQWASLLPHFNFTVVRQGRGANFNESYLGLGILYGLTDYTDWSAKSDAEAIEVATAATSHPSQPIHFINKDTMEVHTHLAIILLRDGWHVVCCSKRKA